VKREQLEHILRAASRIVDERDFLVVGSAAVLGTFGDDQLPYEATRSDEADIAPYNDPDGEKSLRIEGSLGQGSQFHTTFGYYADGVDFGTAIVPTGWKERLVSFATEACGDGRGWCLERHDLAAAKLAAGRQKDYEFVGALLDAGLLDLAVVAERLELLPRDRALPAYLAKARAWVKGRPATG
jgi:hypothetical protein